MKKHKLQVIIAIIIITLTFISKEMTENFYMMRFNKFILLLILPFLFSKVLSKETLSLKINGKITGTLSLLVFSIIVIAYFVLRLFIWPQAIAEDLITTYNLSPVEIVIAGLYTIFINAFCEEYFFRFFLLNKDSKVFSSSSIFSASMFTLYHLSIMGSWFTLPVMILSFVGLLVLSELWVCIGIKGTDNSYEKSVFFFVMLFSTLGICGIIEIDSIEEKEIHNEI